MAKCRVDDQKRRSDEPGVAGGNVRIGTKVALRKILPSGFRLRWHLDGEGTADSEGSNAELIKHAGHGRGDIDARAKGCTHREPLFHD